MKWHLSFLQPSPPHGPHGCWGDGVIYYQSWLRLIPSHAVIDAFTILHSYCKLRIKVSLHSRLSPNSHSSKCTSTKSLFYLQRAALVPTKSFLILCTQSHRRCTQESRKILTKFYAESCMEGVGENVWEGEKNSTSRTRKGRGCFRKTLNSLKYHPGWNKQILQAVSRHPLETVYACCHHQKEQPKVLLHPEWRRAIQNAILRLCANPWSAFGLSSAISSVLIIEQQASSGTNQCTCSDEDANCKRETESLLKLDHKS